MVRSARAFRSCQVLLKNSLHASVNVHAAARVRKYRFVHGRRGRYLESFFPNKRFPRGRRRKVSYTSRKTIVRGDNLKGLVGEGDSRMNTHRRYIRICSLCNLSKTTSQVTVGLKELHLLHRETSAERALLEKLHNWVMKFFFYPTYLWQLIKNISTCHGMLQLNMKTKQEFV